MEGNNHLEVAAQAAQRLSILAKERGLTLTEGQQKQFCTYAGLLLEWNERINLTRIVDAEGIAALHFLDSVMPLTIEGLIPEGARVIDVGSGAGFPGIALKIMRPDIQLTLNDALQKRLNFLEEVCTALGIERVQFAHGRAEELAALHSPLREAFDIVTARAVAALPTLVEWLLPLCKVGGRALCLKGEAPGEVESSARALQALGGKVERIIPLPVPGGEGHRLILCSKQQPTTKRFPRRPGEAKRKPL